MSTQESDKRDDKREQAEFGKGAAGDQWAVQTAQTTEVNPPDEEIPANVNVGLNKKQLDAARHQEDDTDLKTTDGYVLTESGQLNNFAVEPPMYYEDEQGDRVPLGE